MPKKKNLVDPVFDKTRARWKIDVPKSASDCGKRYRAWFKTRDLAREHLAGINGTAEPTAAIAPALAMEADKARLILEPWNLDLVEAAKAIALALEALGDAGSLLEAAKAYRATHVSRLASKPMGEAVATYLDSRADLRDSTQRSYRYTLQGTFRPLAEIVLADITTADLAAILEAKAPTSRAVHKRNLSTFWRWASTPPRGWVPMDTVTALEAIRISSDNDIVIFTPADVKALMSAAEVEKAAAAFAIAIFGGVRMAELGRLTWGNVSEEYIEIGKSVAKKHSRRLVPICPTLRAWMNATRGEATADTPIVPSNWVEVSKAVRRRAGWHVVARLLAKPPKPTRGAWPANACRHTCASVQVAIGTALDDLTFKFGHSGGHDLLRKHYVSRLTKKAALEILATGPKGSKVANIQAA